MRLVARGCLKRHCLAAALWPNAYAGLRKRPKSVRCCRFRISTSRSRQSPSRRRWGTSGGRIDVTIIPVNGSKEVAIRYLPAMRRRPCLACRCCHRHAVGTNLDVQYYSTCIIRIFGPLSVVEDSPIKSVKDLKGKKIGVLSIAAPYHVRACLCEGGRLQSAIDVTFVPIVPAVRLSRRSARALSMRWSSTMRRWRSSACWSQDSASAGQRRTADLPDTSILARPGTSKKKRAQLVGFARPLPKVICLPSPTRRQRSS